MTETIIVEHSPRAAATLVLNRAERGNAFNQLMLNELHQVLSELSGDTSVRALVIRGAGKHFCTGADIGGHAGGAGGVSLGDALARLDTFPKPVIALVQGGAVGGGLALAACCDVLLAQEGAFFSVPELRVGIAPSRELTGYFMRAMGPRAFRRYGLSGERIAAAEALRLGLAHEIVAADDAAARVAKLIDEFLHCAPEASAELKRRIAQVAAGEAVEQEAAEPRGLERSPESKEGVAAYREKRKPSWYPAI